MTVSYAGTGGSGNAAWVFCDDIGIPVWTAFRDGSGPWTRVPVDAQNVFRFQIDVDRGSIAWVEVVGGSPWTSVPRGSPGALHEPGVIYQVRSRNPRARKGKLASTGEVDRFLEQEVRGVFPSF